MCRERKFPSSPPPVSQVGEREGQVRAKDPPSRDCGGAEKVQRQKEAEGGGPGGSQQPQVDYLQQRNNEVRKLLEAFRSFSKLLEASCSFRPKSIPPVEN